jgi:chloride channel protein, CIC family
MTPPVAELPDTFRTERRYAWLMALSALTGLLGATGNVVFRATIAGATWLFHDVIAAPLGRYGILCALIAGGLLLLLLDRVFPGEVLGYGFPRFLEMLHLQGARVKRRWMVVKTLGSAISLGAGAAVGREGPIAQIGGSIGSAVARLSRLSTEQRKVLIACGAAAGIATTFNAPLGALMFAQEIVLLGEIQLPDFSLIVIATVTAVAASRGIFGNASVFPAASFDLVSYWECFTYGLLGIGLGLLAAGYNRLFHAIAGWLQRLRWPRGVVLLGGLAVVGILDIALPGNISDGYPIVNDALAGHLHAGLMAMLAAAKIFTSSVSLGCGAPGGVFGPIFFVGAMSGGAFRAVSALLLPGLTGPRGSYALVGLGAFLGATTHAPLTAIFLLFEMTQNYTIAVPALISTVMALAISAWMEPESIDTLGLSAEGKSLHPRTDRQVLDRIPVESVYRKDVETIPAACPLAEILRIVSESSNATTFPVVNDVGALVGVLSFAALRALLLDRDHGQAIVAADLCDPHVPTLKPDAGLGEAFRLMEGEGLEDIPVVDPADPRRLVGMLSRGDLIGAYNRTVAVMGARPLPGWPAMTEAEWSDRYRVVALPVPQQWVGRTLRELDCRVRYGVVVVAVHPAGRKDGDGYEMPDPDRPLASGDTLIVAGTAESLRAGRLMRALR